MISKQAVEDQLKRIGFTFRFWSRAEVNELHKIMIEDEIIAECVNGEYTNGFALLLATNHRVLVVDKKPMLYLTVEDVRYDMITEFSYNHRMMNSTIRIFTTNKTMQFKSWNQPRLRRLLEYTQQRVLEMRQQAHMAQQFQAAAAAQYAQLHAANYYQPNQVQIPNGSPGFDSNMTANQPSFSPNLAAQPPVQFGSQPQASEQTVTAQPMPQPQAESAPAASHLTGINPQAIVSRLAAKRSALGTYTRSKLPSLRHHRDHQDNATPAAPQSGEVYPQGYAPGRPVTDYGLPYQY